MHFICLISPWDTTQYRCCNCLFIYLLIYFWGGDDGRNSSVSTVKRIHCIAPVLSASSYATVSTFKIRLFTSYLSPLSTSVMLRLIYSWKKANRLFAFSAVLNITTRMRLKTSDLCGLNWMSCLTLAQCPTIGGKCDLQTSKYVTLSGVYLSHTFFSCIDHG